MDVSGLKLGEQCTYHIATPCGYPRVNITMADVTNPDDFDIYYGFGEWNYTNEFSPTLYKKTWFEKDDVEAAKGSDVANKFVTFKKGVDADSFQYCNGTIRNLYIAITRTAVTYPDSALAASSRVLQSSKEKVNLVFGVYEGAKVDESAIHFASSLVLAALAVFMTLAF